MKPFRAKLKRDRDLRLCGKRIVLHCDADGDKSISDREWNICVGVKEGKCKKRVTTFDHEKTRRLKFQSL